MISHLSGVLLSHPRGAVHQAIEVQKIAGIAEIPGTAVMLSEQLPPKGRPFDTAQSRQGMRFGAGSDGRPFARTPP
jgi:hypothetical protein